MDYFSLFIFLVIVMLISFLIECGLLWFNCFSLLFWKNRIMSKCCWFNLCSIGRVWCMVNLFLKLVKSISNEWVFVCWCIVLYNSLKLVFWKSVCWLNSVFIICFSWLVVCLVGMMVFILLEKVIRFIWFFFWSIILLKVSVVLMVWLSMFIFLKDNCIGWFLLMRIKMGCECLFWYWFIIILFLWEVVF